MKRRRYTVSQHDSQAAQDECEALSAACRALLYEVSEEAGTGCGREDQKTIVENASEAAIELLKLGPKIRNRFTSCALSMIR